MEERCVRGCGADQAEGKTTLWAPNLTVVWFDAHGPKSRYTSILSLASKFSRLLKISMANFWPFVCWNYSEGCRWLSRHYYIFDRWSNSDSTTIWLVTTSRELSSRVESIWIKPPTLNLSYHRHDPDNIPASPCPFCKHFSSCSSEARTMLMRRWWDVLQMFRLKGF
jgi:hypothetical protein